MVNDLASTDYHIHSSARTELCRRPAEAAPALRAVQKTQPSALALLSQFYSSGALYDGSDSEDDNGTAKKLLRQAAEKRDPYACGLWGRDLLTSLEQNIPDGARLMWYALQHGEDWCASLLIKMKSTIITHLEAAVTTETCEGAASPEVIADLRAFLTTSIAS